MVNQRILTLLGKVDRRVLKKMHKEISGGKDNTWYFIDYTSENVKVGERFDTLLEGTEKKLVHQRTKAKIKEVYDQFGTKLAFIPKGFQTILYLEFSPDVPSKINDLPTLMEWRFNQNPVSLAKHEDIRLSEPDSISYGMNEAFVVYLKNELIKKNKLPKSSLIQFLITKYNARNILDATRIINRWKNLGLVEEGKNDELELLPQSS